MFVSKISAIAWPCFQMILKLNDIQIKLCGFIYVQICNRHFYFIALFLNIAPVCSIIRQLL